MNQVSIALLYSPSWQFLGEPEMAKTLECAVFGMGGWMKLPFEVLVPGGKYDSVSSQLHKAWQVVLRREVGVMRLDGFE